MNRFTESTKAPVLKNDSSRIGQHDIEAALEFTSIRLEKRRHGHSFQHWETEKARRSPEKLTATEQSFLL